MVKDIFNNKIICNSCDIIMLKGETTKNGIRMRTVKCQKCGDEIIHPRDLAEYEQFMNLKNKTYKVKLRLVGNSYAVSIPKEIIDFVREQERMMDDIVRLCMNDARKLSLMFGEEL